MEQYLAIIGDLIHSREIEDRKQVQKQIKKAFQTINDDYPELILSKLTLTLGDEFQFLTKPQEGIFELLDQLEMELGLPFRLGIGYGSLLTEINPDISIGADGEAFWNARDAITHVHDKDWSGKSRVRVKGFGEEEDLLLNALLATSDTLKSQWTDLQRETFHEMLKRRIYRESFDQKPFAQELGISESNLSKRLSTSNIKLYLHARRAIESSMEAHHAKTQ